MADSRQFPKGWQSDALGEKLGGPFVRPKSAKPTGPKNLNEAITTDGATSTVTAAADSGRPIAPKSKRRR